MKKLLLISLSIFIAFSFTACKQSLVESEQSTHTHSYSNYVCSCGIVDKTHSYEYFLEFIQKNGTALGDRIGIHEISEDRSVSHSITYNNTDNYLYVSILSSDGFVSVYLNSNNQEFDFFSSYGTTNSPTHTMSGKIDGKTFNENSPVTCISYSGNNSDKNWFLEQSRLAVNSALVYLNDYITRCVPGITLKDLGFDSF